MEAWESHDSLIFTKSSLDLLRHGSATLSKKPIMTRRPGLHLSIGLHTSPANKGTWVRVAQTTSPSDAHPLAKAF